MPYLSDTAGGVTCMCEKLDACIAELQGAPNNTRCARLSQLLQSLGFEVRKGSRGNHQVYIHPKLDGFISASFDGGHGKNPQVKSAYVKCTIRVLKQYESELCALLGEKK